MKKMVIILGIIIISFGSLYAINTIQTNKAMENNPFGKDDLHPSTVSQLNNPLYQNIILPDELEAQLEAEETLFVYFYSPECSTCREMSPIIVPTAEDLGIDLKLLNLLEFPEEWNKYPIPITPTIVHFVEGKIDVDNLDDFILYGRQTKETVEEWFEERVE